MAPAKMLELIDMLLGLPWIVYAAILLGLPPLSLFVVRALPTRKLPRIHSRRGATDPPTPPQTTQRKHQQN